ncbi:hypothetical protein BLNAU_11310 [Blattamonas nauphoetae]|uniref:Uncharacterized protein n=1 Tax=Blattamonas nauphoetae TaxID=2049346 RepID=A0ABQ9XMX6_9EUKA|nr:hypothetical protein BLNAU_11310 [Blattamonas nauphoetae]
MYSSKYSRQHPKFAISHDSDSDSSEQEIRKFSNSSHLHIQTDDSIVVKHLLLLDLPINKLQNELVDLQTASSSSTAINFDSDTYHELLRIQQKELEEHRMFCTDAKERQRRAETRLKAADRASQSLVEENNRLNLQLDSLKKDWDVLSTQHRNTKDSFFIDTRELV